MHRYSQIILVLISGLLLAGAASAQEASPIQDPDKGSGICLFIDEDGDGFNDLAPDADGDGIPNGLDPDYVKPLDGEGQQHQWKWVDGLFAKAFAYSLNENSQGNHHGSNNSSEMHAGPGTGIGFGIGTGTGTINGENLIEHAIHRGGRR